MKKKPEVLAKAKIQLGRQIGPVLTPGLESPDWVNSPITGKALYTVHMRPRLKLKESLGHGEQYSALPGHRVRPGCLPRPPQQRAPEQYPVQLRCAGDRPRQGTRSPPTAEPARVGHRALFRQFQTGSITSNLRKPASAGPFESKSTAWESPASPYTSERLN